MLALAAPSTPARGEEPVALGDGVYAFVRSMGEVEPANRGEIGNIGFVVGEHGTLMINTGASYRDGKALLEAAERIGARPVVLAVITQPLQEYVMGMAALAERGIEVLAHVDSAELIAARCETCLHNLHRLLGDAEMHGTRVVVPDRRIAETTRLEAGGRTFELRHPGRASSPGDLLVRDLRTGTVFAGALASFGRVPEVRDGNTVGWLAAIDDLTALDPPVIVPGYGMPGTVAELDGTRRYLAATTSIVRQAFDAGVSLSGVAAATELPRFAGWAAYRPIHSRNAQHLYLEFERALLDQ